MSYENVPKNDDETAVLVEVSSPLNEPGDAIQVETVMSDHPLLLPEFYADSTVSSTLASAAASQTRYYELTDATGFSVGDVVSVLTNVSDRKFPRVVAIDGNTLELDKLIDGSYPAGTAVYVVPVAMNIVGDSASPTVYKVAPPTGVIWDISKLIVGMSHGSAGDMGLFGDLDELTYGVQVRLYSSVEGTYTSKMNWKTNADITLDVYSIKFDTRSGGGGTYGTTAEFRFDELQTVITLDGDNGEELQILIHDDLSDLDSFEMRAQGFVK